MKKEKIKKRKRGAAIIEIPKGILICEMRNLGFGIPGGGVKWYETAKMAAIREVKEELCLKTKSAKYLFDFVGPIHRNKKGKLQQNFSKVFVLEIIGEPKPDNEVGQISYWKPGCKLNLMKGTVEIIEKYKEYKKNINKFK